MRVFISYSHRDRTRAFALADVLADNGHEVGIDRGLRAGERFSPRLMAQIDDAEAVIVLWTKNSVHSSWVHKEADRGRKKLRPVRFRIQPPEGFATLHTPDLPLLSTAHDIAAAVGLVEVAPPRSQPEPPRWL